MAGRVFNSADRALVQDSYDIVLLGGGILGLTCAFYLRKLLPEASVLLIEEEGIPSEQGASHSSPGILAEHSYEGLSRQKYRWVLQTLTHLAEETQLKRAEQVLYQTGMLRFAKDLSGPSDSLSDLGEARILALTSMLEPEHFPAVYWDRQAAYAHVEAAALAFGFAAVKLGLDLMLNTRAESISERVLGLKRLEYNRYMQRVIVKEERLSVKTVIVALGSKTAGFIEAALGEVLPYKQVYRQYPRIEADKRLPLKAGRVDLPIIQASGFYIRPQGEGLLIVPPDLPADPAGYKPIGGKLMGVRVGLRRELLECFLEAMPDLTLLAWESLNLGKSLTNVRGSWDSITPGGLPEWRQVTGSSWYSLIGGRHGLALGIAEAYDLAASLAGLVTRPWLER